MLDSRLNSNGYPTSPQSINCGLKKANVECIDFRYALRNELKISIPCQFLGRREYIAGNVLQINTFPDGEVVILKPDERCLYNHHSWKQLVLWIPNRGMIGIL